MQPTQTNPQPPVVSGPITGGVDTPPPKNSALPKVLLIVAALLVVGAVLWIGVSVYNQNQTSQVGALQDDEPTVSIGVSGFSPSTIKVKANQEVTWTNEDVSEHRLTADESDVPGLDSIEPLTTGDSYTYIFESSGVFHYYDPDNPTQYRGTVVVE